MTDDWTDGYRAGLGSAILTIDRRAAQLHPAIAAILTDLAQALRTASALVRTIPATGTPDTAQTPGTEANRGQETTTGEKRL